MPTVISHLIKRNCFISVFQEGCRPSCPQLSKISITTQHYIRNSVNSICKDDRAYGTLYGTHWIHDKIFIPIYSKSKELSFHSKNRFSFFQKEICWTFQHIICLIRLNWSWMNLLPMIIIPINLFLIFLYPIILIKRQ